MSDRYKSYPFASREFYGPLKLYDHSASSTERIDAFEHPEDKTKIVRVTEKAFLFNPKNEAVDTQVDLMHGLLYQFDRFDVGHVNPSFFVELSEDSRPEKLVISVDLIHDARPCYDILENENLTDDEFHEFDALFGKLARYIIDVEQHGGVISNEVVHLSQFVYSSDLPKGNKVVLVDVEPIGLRVEFPGESSGALQDVTESLVNDVLLMCSDRPDLSLSAKPYIIDAINGINIGQRSGWLERSLEKVLAISF